MTEQEYEAQVEEETEENARVEFLKWCDVMAQIDPVTFNELFI